MARDCFEPGRCDGHGPPTSFAGLFQGVLWTNTLGLARLVRLMPRTIGLLLIGLHMLVIAATARRFRAEGPLLVLWLGVGASFILPVVLWSPTLFLPAMILTTWLTLEWLEQPRWPLALGVGLLVSPGAWSGTRAFLPRHPERVDAAVAILAALGLLILLLSAWRVAR